MQRDLQALHHREFDVVVVGGGIFGICVAWDAVLRGLSVALIEKDDWGGATSANHFKLIHGGLRYLQHLDLQRVRESSQERNVLLRIAPHLMTPVPFVVPTYGHGLQGPELMRAALAVYDLLVADRNRGIRDPARRIPAGRIISRAEYRRLFPDLDQPGLTGAAVFYEVQVYNPPRLSLAFVRSAMERGAVAANYVEARGFLRRGERICGVRARDRLSGDEFDVRARCVVNATGPWAKWLVQEGLGRPLQPEPTFSRDAYFVVKGRLTGDHALAILGQTRDPDAVLSRGRRHLFLVPWRQYTLIGVWHKVHTGRPECFTVTHEELQAFLDEVNTSCPALGLELSDVTRWNAGLTLFGDNDPQARDLRYGHRSLIIDHRRVHGLDGLITLIGVRFTTARNVATRTVDRVLCKLGERPRPSPTGQTRLTGGQIDDIRDYQEQVYREWSSRFERDTLQALVANYGTLHKEVLALARDHPELGQPLPGSSVLRAQVVHAVREEMALKLSDVVFRRTDLATGEDPGDEALWECGRWMAQELGWSSQRLSSEVEEAKACIHRL